LTYHFAAQMQQHRWRLQGLPVRHRERTQKQRGSKVLRIVDHCKNLKGCDDSTPTLGKEQQAEQQP
jgi:hypothetical protein